MSGTAQSSAAEGESGTTVSLDEVAILPRDGSDQLALALDLAGDHALTVRGRDDDADRLAVQVVADGTPLVAEPVGESFFARTPGRERFENAGARLLAGIGDVDEPDALSAIATALDAVQERLATGRLVVADQHARDVLDQTQSVVFDPHGHGTWAVTFEGERFYRRKLAYEVPQLTVSAEEWSATEHAPQLPRRVSDVFGSGEQELRRWQTCRQVWEQAATVGEHPDPTTPLSEDLIRDRDRIPQVSAGVEEFEALVRDEDNETLRHVRRAIDGSADNTVAERAVQVLDLADELEDVEPAEDAND